MPSQAKSRQSSASTETAPTTSSGPTQSTGRGNAANQEQAGLGSSGGITVVAPGDTLWAIAARELGDGTRWEELATLNQIADASLILPGQMIRLPPTASASPSAGPQSEAKVSSGPADAPTVATAPLGQAPSTALEEAQAQESAAEGGFWSKVAGAVQKAIATVRSFLGGLFGGRSEEAPAPSTDGPTTDGPTTDPEVEQPKVDKPKTPAPEEAPEPVIHTVYPGDNLWSIAQQYLGDGGRWREIAEANGLDNPSLLRVGQTLRIPGASPSGPVPEPSPVHDSGPVSEDKGGEGMGPGDPIALGGLRGLDHTMAVIYNDKGRYLKQKASALGISSAAAAAVLKCESGGAGFHRTSGKMIIRFENHIFWDQWGSSNASRFHEHFLYSSGQRWTGHKYRMSPTDPWASFHGTQSKEWQVLELARSMNDTAALKSISMGAAQVMGFNYKTLGYASVQDMFESMSVSLPSQLDGMFAYIQASRTCMAGLQSGNYVQFARGYNGSGQAEHYGALISAAAAAYARVTRGRSQA